MARSVLPEWSGETLVYITPTQTCHRLGWPGPAERDDPLPAEVQSYEKIWARVPLMDGDTAPERHEFGSREEASESVKDRALELGASLVGVTHVDPDYVYADNEVRHAHAVVVAVAMDYEEILAIPRPEADAEFLRVYEAISRIVVDLAARIRALGYPARAHALRGEQLAMIPHAWAAGLGELGKHGSLINRELGCSFRLGVVTTDLPLAEDAPRNDGIQDFCSSCRMCVSYCPGDAISDEKDVVRGIEKWVVDTERCVPYFSQYYACGICLQVCPLNAKAFDGRFRGAFVETVRGLDADELKRSLDAGLPESPPGAPAEASLAVRPGAPPGHPRGGSPARS